MTAITVKVNKTRCRPNGT